MNPSRATAQRNERQRIERVVDLVIWNPLLSRLDPGGVGSDYQIRRPISTISSHVSRLTQVRHRNAAFELSPFVSARGCVGKVAI